MAYIRKETTGNNGQIVFGVAKTDLLKLTVDVDFDSLSNDLISEIGNKKGNYFFEFQGGEFLRKDPNNQNWFIF